MEEVKLESMSKGEVWRVETTEPNASANKPPYRDNTLLEELENAKKRS